MASDRHDDLDELDEEPSFEIVVDEPMPERERKPLNLKPALIGLLVLILGGGLGIGAYLLTAYDTRDLIGLLDVGENPPKLTMAMPGRGEEPPAGGKPQPGPMGGGLLTPPGTAGGEMLKALPDDAPPPEQTPPKPSAAPLDKLAPDVPPPAAPAALPPGNYQQETVLPLPSSTKVALKPPVDASGVPTQPSPRTADKPPSFDTMATPPKPAEAKPLPPAPLKDMLRKTQAGDLPYPAPDGRQPWQAYARPWSGPADKGKIAVVVVDLGLDKAATETAIAKLPPEVALAFSPYAPSLDKWIKKARDFGHEVLMSLPAESAGTPARDPGPYGLMSSLSPEANLMRLETVMSKAAGYVGLISLGGAYAASPQNEATLAAIRDHGLLYIGNGTAPPDRQPPLAAITAVVDQDAFREAIDMRLNQVSIAGRTKGRALAVISPRPLSFDRLMVWINDLAGQNLVLAPPSTLAQPATQPGKS